MKLSCTWRRPVRNLLLFLRRLCIPCASLTRTPGGRHFEWTGAFFEPCLERCEKSVYFVGLVCFFVVLAGISLVVITMYVYMVPFLYHTQHPFVFFLYFVYGNYLFLMICFNYFCGVYTNPGSAPKPINFDPSSELKKGWKLCHKCEAPKPPRAHHCRICNRCVLKMDHHCPWMFNCIGHNNHRYFMVFIIYMWLGTCFVVNCGWTRIFVLLEIRAAFILNIVETLGLRGSLDAALEYPEAGHMEGLWLCLQWFICLGVTLALAILGGWHLYLVSVSETTIEFYTNKRDARKMKSNGEVFTNNYHLGCFNNWVIFLGLVNGNPVHNLLPVAYFSIQIRIHLLRTLLRHILLPSRHRPHHDGMDWDRETLLCYKDKSRTIPV